MLASTLVRDVENLLTMYSADQVCAALKLIEAVRGGSVRLYSRDMTYSDVDHALLDQVHNEYTTIGKIQAIKTLRNATNIGLKDAKERVEYAANAYHWTTFRY